MVKHPSWPGRGGTSTRGHPAEPARGSAPPPRARAACCLTKTGETKEIQHLSRAPAAAPGAVSHPEQSCEQMARGDRPWRGSRCPLQHAHCSGARGGQALPYFQQLWQRSRAFCFTSSHFEAVSIPPAAQARGLHPKSATARDGQLSPASEGCSSRIPRYLRVPKKQHRENKVAKIALLEQFSPCSSSLLLTYSWGAQREGGKLQNAAL